MATREVKVGLRADVTPYIAAIRAAERATSKWADTAVADAARAQAAIAGAGAGPMPGAGPAGPAPAAQAAAASAARAEEARLAKQAEAMQTVGVAATAMGGAVAGGLLMSAKAAIDWESAWAGVTKTVDGTTEEMAGLESELRGMAKTLPIAHTEIAGVAEAAGQLGVKREDIAGFTKTMIDLGVSTNLSAEDAATSIAQMTNVMGTAPADVGRLGAALVALGNAGASTERDIMSMAARLSGAGELVGASEAGVLAMANAMSSVGIEAELGGGSMSRTLLKIYSAVKQAGPELEKFARTAGMSAEEFATAFQEDPMTAVTAFVQGLGRIKDSGGNVVAALGDVKIKGTQDLQVLLRLAGASDMLADSLDLGTQAWEQNTALTDEAGKRYDTVASKLKVARNNAYDLAIQIGDVMLPVIAAMADGVSGAIDLFEKMPGPVREIAVQLGVLTAAALLLGGALLLTIPRIAATRAALQTLAATRMWMMIRANFLGLAAFVGGPWVLAFAAAAAAVGALLLMNRKGKPPIDDLTAAVKADTGALGQNTRAAVANRLEKAGILKIAKDYGISLADVTASVLGNTEAQERLNAAVAAARGPLVAQAASLKGEAKDAIIARILDLDKLSTAEINTSTDVGHATEAAGREAEAALAVKDATSEAAVAIKTRFNEAMGRAGASALETAGMTGKLALGVEKVGEEADAAEKEISGLKDALDDLLGRAFALPEALDAWQKGLNDIVAKGKEGSRSLNRLTNEGIENRDMFRDQARLLPEVARAMADFGKQPDQIAAEIDKMYRALLRQAKAAGFSKTEVAELVDVLRLFPPEIRSRLTVVGTGVAMSAVGDIQRAIDNLHGKNIPITVSSSGAIRSPGGGQILVGGPTMADGGYITGPGGPRDDAIPLWGSNGEYIVNASATARHRGLLDHINAGRYADGGPVGGWAGPLRLPRTLEGVEAALEKLGKSLDKLESTIKEDSLGKVRKEAKEFAATIRSTFTADLASLAGSGGSMVADLQARLDRASAFEGAIGELRKRKLNATAITQLRTAGPEGGGLAAAEELLNGADIGRVNELMGKIAKIGSRFGEAERQRKYGGPIRDAEKAHAEDLAERRMTLQRQAALTRRQRELEAAEKNGKPKTRATRTTATGRTLSAVSSGADLAPVQVKVTFDVTGADKHMKALIRQIVRVEGGGSVQKAFGT